MYKLICKEVKWRSKLLYKSEDINITGNKAKQNSRRIPGTVNFACSKELNIGVLLQSSCNLFFQDIVSMFWTTVLTVLSCLIVTNMVWLNDGIENDPKENKNCIKLVCGFSSTLRVWVTEGKIMVHVCMKEIHGKSILVQISLRFELARVWVIVSQLYLYTGQHT